MNDWREDGQAAHEYEMLMREREEWLRDTHAQQEYQQFLTNAVKDSAKGNYHEQKQPD